MTINLDWQKKNILKFEDSTIAKECQIKHLILVYIGLIFFHSYLYFAQVNSSFDLNSCQTKWCVCMRRFIL